MRAAAVVASLAASAIEYPLARPEPTNRWPENIDPRAKPSRGCVLLRRIGQDWKVTEDHVGLRTRRVRLALDVLGLWGLMLLVRTAATQGFG